MAAKRMITPVYDNYDKQRTYREYIGRYKLAMEKEFYLEAILIDYALIEDRLRSIIYHMGFLSDRKAYRPSKNMSDFLRGIILTYKNPDESQTLTVTNMSGKVRIVRCVLKWAIDKASTLSENKHLSTLKKRCFSLDIDGILKTFDEIDVWCNYRNELIHSLMNKHIESVSDGLQMHAERGMQIVKFIDGWEKALKKGNVIRKSANLPINK